jgi:hypothetical protein
MRALRTRNDSCDSKFVISLFVLNFCRVPLGFVCGYPVGNGGELYGGSMFIKSAATDTLQGKAIHSVNARWGEGTGKWCGTETIGIPVCKKKYAPFSFRIDHGADGKVVQVERMFGCRCHSDVRKTIIETHGVRNGWEPFGQWSLGKAREMARKETERINNGGKANFNVVKEPLAEITLPSDEELRSICNNGNCTWKMKAKYDNIRREVTGHSESSDEE